MITLEQLDRNVAVYGDPDGIRTFGNALKNTASAAREANDIISKIGYNWDRRAWSGAAAQAFYDRLATIPPDLGKLEASYGLAGSALIDYAGALQAAKDKSAQLKTSGENAITGAQNAQAKQSALLSALEQRYEALKKEVKSAGKTPDGSWERSQYARDVSDYKDLGGSYDNAAKAADDAEGSVDAASAAISNMQADLAAARVTCVQKIQAASDAGIQNDDWLKSHLKSAWDFTVGGLKAIAKVTLGVVSAVLTFIAKVAPWISVGLLVLAVLLAPFTGGLSLGLAGLAMAAAAVVGLVGAGATLGQLGVSVVGNLLNKLFGEKVIDVKSPSLVDIGFALFDVVTFGKGKVIAKGARSAFQFVKSGHPWEAIKAVSRPIWHGAKDTIRQAIRVTHAEVQHLSTTFKELKRLKRIEEAGERFVKEVVKELVHEHLNKVDWIGNGANTSRCDLRSHFSGRRDNYWSASPYFDANRQHRGWLTCSTGW